jgi:hypothetical protein
MRRSRATQIRILWRYLPAEGPQQTVADDEIDDHCDLRKFAGLQDRALGRRKAGNAVVAEGVKLGMAEYDRDRGAQPNQITGGAERPFCFIPPPRRRPPIR